MGTETERVRIVDISKHDLSQLVMQMVRKRGDRSQEELILRLWAEKQKWNVWRKRRELKFYRVRCRWKREFLSLIRRPED